MKEGPPADEERRSHGRSPEETRATGLVQAILTNPATAAAALESYLRAGEDASVVGALLEMAAGFARLRGIDPTVGVAWIRQRLSRAGYAVDKQ